MDKLTKLLTLREAAELLNVSIWTLYRWSSQRKLEIVKVGGRCMVHPSSLASWISENTRPAV